MDLPEETKFPKDPNYLIPTSTRQPITTQSNGRHLVGVGVFSVEGSRLALRPLPIACNFRKGQPNHDHDHF